MKKSDCPGCNEGLSPWEWWKDLAMRLDKAVYCLKPKDENVPPGRKEASAIKVFEAAAVDAHDLAAQLMRLTSRSSRDTH